MVVAMEYFCASVKLPFTTSVFRINKNDEEDKRKAHSSWCSKAC
jgi:hypothetical protein